MLFYVPPFEKPRGGAAPPQVVFMFFFCLQSSLNPCLCCQAWPLVVRKAENGSVAAAAGRRNSLKLHLTCWHQQTVALQQRGGSPGRVWGGRGCWRTGRRRRGGWRCTEPTGGGATSHTERRRTEEDGGEKELELILVKAVSTQIKRNSTFIDVHFQTQIKGLWCWTKNQRDTFTLQEPILRVTVLVTTQSVLQI